MKYLFFDIETLLAQNVNPRIVSFGYVLTDENFNEISKEDILINPKDNSKVVERSKVRQWKQDETKDKEGFKVFYNKIKS